MPDKTIESSKGKCFVIMPIGELKELEKDHFKKIYEQIFKPAIESANFVACRADDDKSSHFIQSSIIKDLIEAPMALCDLSTKNPNVLYELGIRHAFDKPVVLVQQEGTDRIFDINGIKTVDYRPTRLYDEVLEDIDEIGKAIRETAENRDGKYSLLKLIEVSAAKSKNPDISEEYKTEILLGSLVDDIKEIKRTLGGYNNINMAREDETKDMYFSLRRCMNILDNISKKEDLSIESRNAYIQRWNQAHQIYNILIQKGSLPDNKICEIADKLRTYEELIHTF